MKTCTGRNEYENVRACQRVRLDRTGSAGGDRQALTRPNLSNTPRHNRAKTKELLVSTGPHNMLDTTRNSRRRPVLR